MAAKQDTSNNYAWNKLQDEKADWEYAVLHIRGREDNVIRKGEAYWYTKDDMIVLVPKNNVYLPWIPPDVIKENGIKPDYKLEIAIAKSELVSVEFFKPAGKIIQIPKGTIIAEA